MDKKEIQEQRMRGYFIEATKEILKGEGIVCASVRNIADRAGYSYATLYNYFKDVKDLIFLCVEDFQKECEELVKSETAKIEPGTDKIKGIIKAYVKYFIQYPGIFDLFYLEKINNISNKKANTDQIYSFLDAVCAKEWEYCKKNKIFKAAKINAKKDMLRYTITGMLLFYLNRRHPDSYGEFMKNIDSQLSLILEN